MNFTSAEEGSLEEPLNGQHIVMLLGMTVMIIVWFDLDATLSAMDDQSLAKKVRYMAFAGVVLYVCEFLLTLGSLITAICPGALWALGITHYSIKVIVSYSYCVRVNLVIQYKQTALASMMVQVLQGIIWLTAVANIIKVRVDRRFEPGVNPHGCDPRRPALTPLPNLFVRSSSPTSHLLTKRRSAMGSRSACSQSLPSGATWTRLCSGRSICVHWASSSASTCG